MTCYSFNMSVIPKNNQRRRRLSGQTRISSSFQTTITAEAVRVLKLKPGMKLTQTVEGDRLILEPLQDVDSLAGSLATGKAPVSVEAQNKGAKEAITKAAMKGLHPDE